MDRQLYFLLDNVSECRKLVAFLDEHRLRYSFLKVKASAGTDLQGLASISFAQKAEKFRKILIGVLGGGIAGVLGGVLAVTSLPINDVSLSDSKILLMSSGVGVILGLLISPIIGLHERSRNVDQFQRAINSGRVLLMLEMPREYISKTINLVERNINGAEVALVRS